MTWQSVSILTLFIILHILILKCNHIILPVITITLHVNNNTSTCNRIALVGMIIQLMDPSSHFNDMFVKITQTPTANLTMKVSKYLKHPGRYVSEDLGFDGPLSTHVLCVLTTS